MKAGLLALALLAASTRAALADGWIDCNGPDKNGRGCSTTGGDTAATVAGLAIVGAVAFGIARRRRRR